VAKYHNNATAVKFNEDVTIDSLEIVEVNEDWKKIFKENLIPSNIVIEKDMEEIR